MKLSPLLNQILPSPTMEIIIESNKKKAEGIHVLSFGAGQPNFDTPPNIKKAAQLAIEQGFTQYTDSAGIIELRLAVADFFKTSGGLEYDATKEIIVSAGAKQVLSIALLALCSKNDEVIIPSPYWVSYPEMVKIAGATPIIVPTNKVDFSLDVTAIKNSITSRTKAIIINSPNNPAGAVYSAQNLRQLSQLCKEKNIFIISDEVYDFLTYDKAKFVSILQADPSLKPQTLVVNAVSKKYAMTGWRIGYGAGPSPLIAAMTRLQNHFSSSPNSIAQKAALEALKGDQSSVEIMAKSFAQRADFAYTQIKKIPLLDCQKPQGAFYLWVNIANLYQRQFKNQTIKNDFDFCKLALEHKNIAFVPGSSFGDSDYIRISFACDLEDLKTGLSLLADFVAAIN